LAGYEKDIEALRALDAKVCAASVDDADKASEVAANLSFPVAYGVTRADADAIGAWWEEKRGIIQPSEFIVAADGRVVSSTYSSGPIGRMDAVDVLKLIDFYESKG